MNWANRITLFRVILLPIIIVLISIYPMNNLLYNGWDQVITIKSSTVTYSLPISYLIAGILFILASLSDLLDGIVARKYNMVTTFGKFFDAVADKLLINGVLIVFSIAHLIPLWITLILVLRDFLIDVVRQVLAAQNVIMAADKWGKWKAAFEMFGITLLFFVAYPMFNGVMKENGKFDEYGYVNQIILIPMYIATVLSLVSASNYIYLNRKNIFARGK